MPFHTNSLFERLLLGRRGYAPSRHIKTSAVLASILQNLSQILNTNQGSSLSRPEYGIPDFNQIIANFPDAIPWLTSILTEQITLFEPRLRACRVRFVDDPDIMISGGIVTLNFVITAELALFDHNEMIRFSTVLADDRKFYVKV